MLKKSDIWLMSICTGLIVANIYYCQPLIVLIAEDFQIPQTTSGSINYLTQIGYALGLLFLVPLGDKWERKTQITATTAISVLALLMMASAPNFFVLQIGSVLVGATSIVPQLILPLGATLSTEEKRGSVVGTIMGGLLIGIVASRSVSGAIGEWYGWREMFYIAALICILLLFFMHFKFPSSKPNYKGTYTQLFKSMWFYVKTEPVLRQASVINILSFIVISGFWTVMVLYLSSAVYQYSSLQIGFFGIVGALGALAAPLVGKLSDGGNSLKNLIMGMVFQLVSYVLFWCLGGNVWMFIIGVILVDVGQQSVHITNQTRIYALVPEARNRLNTVFMTLSFIGAALGSLIGIALYKWGGWNYFCIGMIFCIIVNIILYYIFNKLNQK